VKSITDEPANYQKMVRLTKEKFEKLVKEVEPTIFKTTFRGTMRKQKVISTSKHSVQPMIFEMLFWLAHYPILALMSAIFWSI
jgi:hypothetical protein